MKYKDVKKFSKLELLQLVYALRSELDKKEAENKRLKRNLDNNKDQLDELIYNSRIMARQLSKLTGDKYKSFDEEKAQIKYNIESEA